MRVVVVGGGCAGLSSALHLAPLVEAGYLASPIDVFDANSGLQGREIGVGIWSTALDPFQHSERESHQLVYRDMSTHGSWVGDVGYRTPKGAWLLKSHLPISQQEMQGTGMPALLFLREKDMLASLQKAVHWEEHRGTIKLHRDGNKTRVHGINENCTMCWSTQLKFQGDQISDRDYHLIVAADGTHSQLRQTYGGHDSVARRPTGTSALPSPIDLPHQSSMDTASWDEAQRKHAVGLQDRDYTVFRGNARLTTEEIGVHGTSFQTWGEGRSMRFATVPMLYPGPMNKRQERQVWFVTIDDDEIANETDPVKRRAMVLDAFKDWHDPVCRMIEATEPEEILMERAIAHRHCMGPVTNLNKVIKSMRGKRPPSSGQGACLIFIGDAYMTVDPILAQGFTFAMEGAYALRNSVQQSCKPFAADPTFAFNPHLLRDELKSRHRKRMDRLICLLRATELVQALGQPSGGTLSGTLNTKILRPLTRLSPNFIKRPIFDAVLKYSLGFPQSHQPVVEQKAASE